MPAGEDVSFCNKLKLVLFGGFFCTEIKMKRLESPPSGHFMFVVRVPVAPLTIRRHIVSETKPML